MADDIETALTDARETGRLDFTGRTLKAVPGEVRKLTELRELDLSGCAIERVPGWIAELQSLAVLDLSNNPLGLVPSGIQELTGLRSLQLWECSIDELPPWVNKLSSLEVLNVAGNPIGDIPMQLGAVRSLRRLGLSGTNLSSFDEVLSYLTGLESLSLSGNSIRVLPSWIGNLRQLKYLNLGLNFISSLPDEISCLRQLRYLYLWGHGLEEVPEVLGSLSQLEILDLSHGGNYPFISNPRNDDRQGSWRQGVAACTLNGELLGVRTDSNGLLRRLPHWVADAFPALRMLHVGRQRLESLPPVLSSKLEALYVEGNTFDVFPPVALTLPTLQEIDLQHNNLRDLPSDLMHKRGLRYLNLADNPLSVPPEILAESKNPSAILDFLCRMSGPTRRLDEAKLLVVGEGSVGKTSLIERLVLGTFSEHNKTEGIDVTRWTVDRVSHRVRVNVWDFGGQEIMHATHQFFLTKRSLYVLVIDARQDQQQNRIEHWLKLIQGFSEHSPVIIVGNKTDQIVQQTATQTKVDIDERGLRNKYPEIVAVCSVSCKTGDGIPEIQGAIQDVIGQLPHVQDLLPRTFFDVKAELEALETNYLLYDDYIGLCRERGVTTEKEQEELIRFLHDLGTVLCFRDDPRLAHTEILNPSWVTGGVYKVLNAHLAFQRKGLLTWADIDKILDTEEYPTERRAFIVEMMKRFELCYEQDHKLLVPDLLTKGEPDTGAWNDALRIEIHYDVLPLSIISRLIVRMHASISKDTVWRTGVVLAMDQNRALVRADLEDRLITIAVTGPVGGQRGLLTTIRSHLRDIASTVPGLVADERVPVPGNPDRSVSYDHLLQLEVAGHQHVIPEGLTETFEVRELLAGVEDPRDRDRTRTVAKLAWHHNQPTDAPSADDPGIDDHAQPWTPAEALQLGRLIVASLLAFMTVFIAALVVTDRFTDTSTATTVTTAITTATTAATLVGMLVLRSSGRVSEQGLIDTVRRSPHRN